jgi:predicted N-acetyltransferase YhbS
VGNPLYYSRFGFEMAGPRNLSCGGPHDPFLQVLELEPGALSNAHGHVEFHEAFAELE